MSQRIRGAECTIQVIVDGDLQGGTFLKVTDFNLVPRQETPEVGFLGEKTDDVDFQHHGYDFDMTVQQQDSKVLDLLFQLVEGETNNERYPAINVVATFAYRAGLDSAQSIVLEETVLKIDSINVGGRKEYVTNKLSGKCREVNPVA
jgi:hypothetical protein